MADATVSDSEIEELRFHLGYGNIAVDGYPYTPDGFVELFTQVIQPYLGTAAETTATTAVTAGAIAVVTPVSMTSIAVNTRLIVDVGDDAEDVIVKAVTATTFTARFALAHAATGYPVAVASGIARLRMLLHRAQAAWSGMQTSNVANVAGLKRADEVEWYQGGLVLKERLAQYRMIVGQLSSLVRVAIVDTSSGSTSRVEAY